MPPRMQVKPTIKPTVDKSKVSPRDLDGDWRGKVLNGSILLSNILLQVSQFASVLGLQNAARAVSTVLNTIEKVKANKEDFQIIADDASDLIVAIWHAQEKAETPKKWLSPEVRDMVMNLKKTLDEVNIIALRQTRRNMLVRVIFSMADAGKIRQTREKIKQAVMKFGVLSHIKVNDLLLDIMEKQQQLSEQIKNRNEAENAEEEEDDEDEDDEEDDEPASPVSRQPDRPTRARPVPRPSVGPNPAKIENFSFSNQGSGTMYNRNVGNIVNTSFSNIGNNNSENHIYESSRRRSPGVRRS